jgi:hypothetical protein
MPITTDAFDGRSRCPNAPGEDLLALIFLHDPVLTGLLYPAGQGGLTRKK